MATQRPKPSSESQPASEEAVTPRPKATKVARTVGAPVPASVPSAVTSGTNPSSAEAPSAASSQAEPAVVAETIESTALARVLASLDDLRTLVVAIAERAGNDTPRLLTATENLGAKLEATAIRVAEDTPRLLTALDQIGAKLDTTAASSQEEAPRLLGGLAEIGAKLDATATRAAEDTPRVLTALDRLGKKLDTTAASSAEEAPRLLAALSGLAAKLDTTAASSAEDAPRLLAALSEIAAKLDTTAASSREEAPRLLAVLSEIGAKLDTTAASSAEVAPRLVAALSEIAAKLEALAAAGREDAPRMAEALSGLGARLDTIWGHVTGSRITVDQLRAFGEAVRDKVLVNDLTAMLAADARKAIPSKGGVHEAERLKAAMKFEATWDRQGSALNRMLDAAAESIAKVSADATSALLDRLVLDGNGRKLKTICQEVTDDRKLREALFREATGRKEQAILEVMNASVVAWGSPLAKDAHLGPSLDERIIEVPLAIELLKGKQRGPVLDAGASLNLPFLWEALGAPADPIVHYTFSAENEPIEASGASHSYYFGDLRNIPFRDGTFGRVFCISTLEHVGKDNRRYGGSEENDPRSYMVALRELLRVLAPGGSALITVPYGIAQDHGWYQVFGQREFRTLVGLAAGYDVEAHYYYYDGFWYQGGEKPEAPSTPEIATEEITGMAALRVTKPA